MVCTWKGKGKGAPKVTSLFEPYINTGVLADRILYRKSMQPNLITGKGRPQNLDRFSPTAIGIQLEYWRFGGPSMVKYKSYIIGYTTLSNGPAKVCNLIILLFHRVYLGQHDEIYAP